MIEFIRFIQKLHGSAHMSGNPEIVHQAGVNRVWKGKYEKCIP